MLYKVSHSLLKSEGFLVQSNLSAKHYNNLTFLTTSPERLNNRQVASRLGDGWEMSVIEDTNLEQT